MNILFKGGMIVTPTSTTYADVAVENGKIVAIADELSSSNFAHDAHVVDVSGKYLLPGAIDAHVHLALDVDIAMSADDYESGTRSAACGGTTTVIDYPTQYGDERIVEVVDKRIKMAQDVACIDYGFHCAITNTKNGYILDQFEEAIDAGVTSFKCYTVYKARGLYCDDADLLLILRKAKELGAMINVHCENEDVLIENQKDFLSEGKTSPWYHYLSRPEYVSGEAVNRVVRLAKQLRAPVYIVHTDSDDALTTIQEAKMAGYKVYAETCPQYLEFTKDVYKRDDAYKFVCSPPIKGNGSKNALWTAINDGLISTIATDHCPFLLSEKMSSPDDFTQIPNGCPGVETAYPYMLSQANKGMLTYNKVVELMCSNPARLFGCTKKGEIAIGYDADIVVYDPDKKVTISNDVLHSNCDYTIFEGKEFEGYPVQTYCRGELVFDNGKFVGNPGWGKFIKRQVSELI